MSLIAKIESQQNIIIASLSGKGLDDSDFSPIKNEITEKLSTANNKLIVDLKDVSLINSLGINFLIKLFTKCRNLGGDMYIVNISDKINQVLLLTKLNSVLNIANSIEDAKNNLEL